MSSGYSSQPQTTTTNQTQTPYLSGAVNEAGNTAQYYASQPSLYPQLFPGTMSGSQVAPLTGAQQSGLSSLETNASQPLPATNSATDFANFLETGNFLGANPANAPLGAFASGAYANPASNPYFSSTMTSLMAPAISSAVAPFVSGGNMNNPSMAYAAGQGATNALAPYMSSLYTTGQQNQLTAAGTLGSLWNQGVGTMAQGLALAPQTASLPFIAPQEEYQAGTAEQNQAQNVLNSEISGWNTEQTMPETMNNWLAQIAYGAPGGSTTGMTTQPLYSNNAANILGMGAGATSMLSGIFGGGSNSLYSGLLGAFG